MKFGVATHNVRNLNNDMFRVVKKQKKFKFIFETNLGSNQNQTYPNVRGFTRWDTILHMTRSHMNPHTIHYNILRTAREYGN